MSQYDFGKMGDRFAGATPSDWWQNYIAIKKGSLGTDASWLKGRPPNFGGGSGRNHDPYWDAWKEAMRNGEDPSMTTPDGRDPFSFKHPIWHMPGAINTPRPAGWGGNNLIDTNGDDRPDLYVQATDQRNIGGLAAGGSVPIFYDRQGNPTLIGAVTSDGQSLASQIQNSNLANIRYLLAHPDDYDYLAGMQAPHTAGSAPPDPSKVSRSYYAGYWNLDPDSLAGNPLWDAKGLPASGSRAYTGPHSAKHGGGGGGNGGSGGGGGGGGGPTYVSPGVGQYDPGAPAPVAPAASSGPTYYAPPAAAAPTPMMAFTPQAPVIVSARQQLSGGGGGGGGKKNK